MYNARSKLVHTGQDVTQGRAVGGEALSAAQLIDRATLICVDIIKRIIRNGHIPDWESFDILEQP
jgi:hypothetical protein